MSTQQRQQGGDQSVNLQGGVVFYQGGVSASEARTIAQDVFKANALEMAGLAQSVASERFQYWTEMFLARLERVSPDLFAALKDPDIQYSLFSAQRDYARSGDEQLGESLADLLVRRCQTDPESLTKVVLNEAISTIPKLTHAQVNLLTMIWTLTRTYEPEVTEPDHLSALWLKVLGPLLEKLPTPRAHLEHLSYAGCLTISNYGGSLWELAMASYGRLFSRGVSEEDLSSPVKELWNDERFFKPCLRDPKLKRLAQQTELISEGTTLEENVNFHFGNLRTNNYLMQKDFYAEMSVGFPAIEQLAELWDKSPMHLSNLSTVGIAIAHSNSRRFLGPNDDDSPLELWL